MTRTTRWDCHVHVFDPNAPHLSGHYVPQARPLADIESLATAQDIDHLVIVQPSVYGHDHSVLLQALAQGQGRHRGVAAADASLTDTDLDRLHAAGVRGVRFNRVSPAGHAGDAAADLLALAPRLRERGWHVQWYVQPGELPTLVPLQRAAGLPIVLDHVGGLHAALPPHGPEWQAAAALADGGAWIKLSGWYRLHADPPYATLHPVLQRAAALFGPRCVWGSDWPHTSFGAGPLPDYTTLLQPLRDALGDAATQSILGPNATTLYDTP